jgi:hypothetical protein
MGLKIADLLRWRSNVQLRDANGNYINANGDIVDNKEDAVTIYLRVIGDDDLDESYRLARIASADKRHALEQKDSIDWKEASQPIMEADEEACKVLIRNAKNNNLEAEARANVPRPDLPELEEFAVDPDAASLEEQEKYQAAIDKTDEEYEKAVQEYIDVRKKVVDAELEGLSLDDLRTKALEEVSTILALGEFYAELFDQKAFRGSYLDKTYKERAFDNMNEFKNTDGGIKQQIIDAYLDLEQNGANAKK